MKKFSIIAIIIAIAGMVYISAQTLIEPSKKNDTKTFAITNFDELKVASVYAVEYEQTDANSWSVEITAPQNIMPYVKVKKSGHCLTLALDKSLSTRGNYTLKAKIKAPALNEIDMNGASSFKSDKVNVAGRKLEIEASGASAVEIKTLVASSVELDLRGASSAKINGVSAQVMDLEVDGASNAKISGIKLNNIEVKATGASTAELAGNAQFAVIKATGASDVKAKSLSAAQGSLVASGASTIKAKIANILSQRASGASSIKNEK